MKKPIIYHGDSREVLKGLADNSIDSVVTDPPYALVSIVKPIDLMRYLVRLITPPGGVVLDPFAGSGSTGVAAMLEGFDSILIEREAAYVADIHRKVDFYRGEGRLGAQEKLKAKQDSHDDLPLFGGGGS